MIFAIRTRRVPFFRSHPSIPLVLDALGVVAVGAALPSTPLAHTLGFQALPGDFFIALAALSGSRTRPWHVTSGFRPRIRTR